MASAKKVLKSIKKYRYILVGVVALIILTGVFFPIRTVYKDHNPPNNLINGNTFTLSSGNGYGSTGDFRVPNNWAIAYNYSCDTANDIFNVQVIDTNNDTDSFDDGVNPASYNNGNLINLAGSGTAMQPSKGVYSILINNSGCTYTVFVSANIPSNLPNINLTANQYLQHGYTSQTFTTTTDEWGFNWSYDCTQASVSLPLVVLVENPSGTNLEGHLSTPYLNKYQKASGTEKESQAGTYKLLITTACAVHIKVLNNI